MGLCNLVLTAALTLNPAVPGGPGGSVESENRVMAQVLEDVFVDQRSGHSNWKPLKLMVGEIAERDLLSRYPSLLTGNPDPEEGLAFIEEMRGIFVEVEDGLWKRPENLRILLPALLLVALMLAGLGVVRKLTDPWAYSTYTWEYSRNTMLVVLIIPAMLAAAGGALVYAIDYEFATQSQERALGLNDVQFQLHAGELEKEWTEMVENYER